MAHSQLTVTTTYLDIPMGGNTPGLRPWIQCRYNEDSRNRRK